ncbi:M23 family metallopeptidase [Methylogaea oryzae]|nr:M23 family metallopeptidase [Methylogaea oryzae]
MSASAAHARKMYKFQDDLGRWHYSDAKPQEGMAKSLEVSQVAMDPATAVSLENRDAEGRRQVFASNRWAGPVEVEVTPLEVVNMLVEPPLPHRFVLAGGAVAAPIIDMRLADSRQTGTVRYGYRYTPGDPSAQPEENHAYLPPIAPGSTYAISQGFFGAFSHQGAQNRYAIDIAMPEGTPVHAMRDGVVMAVENDFYESGVKDKLQSRANHIRILHDDGGMAVYAHLALESTQVSQGQKVVAGQLIAHSGRTGYASGPHLHVVIQRNKGMELESMPFLFRYPDGSVREPKEGDVLQGAVVGRP